MLRKLVYQLPSSESGDPPSEFRLFSYGTTDTTKGEYEFDEEAGEECMSAFREYGNRLTIDYEHQALSDPPVQAPAAASFVPQLRSDGLWATDVRWTAKATEYLKNKEYLYFSPAFLHDDRNRPTRILNVALTNLPATKNMTPLVAAKHTEPSMRTVLSALSLKDSASEAEALSAVTKLQDSGKQLMQLTGAASFEEAVALASGWKIAAAEVTALRDTMAKQKEAADAAAFDVAIVEAKAKALLAPSDEHKRNKAALAYRGKPGVLESLRAILSAFDPLIETPAARKAAGAIEPKPADGQTAALTDDEKRMAKKMGVSLEALAKNKARRLAMAAEKATDVELTEEEKAEDNKDAA